MDEQTARCARCAAPLVSGAHYCTSCGAPTDVVPAGPREPALTDTALTDTALTDTALTDTAERTYAIPAAPRPAYAAPPPAYLPPAAPGYGAAQAPSARHARPGPGPGLWIGVVATMVVFLLLGGWLLLHGGGGSATPGSATPPLFPKASSSRTPTGSGSPSSASPSSASSGPVVRGPASNVARLAQASAPAHLPAGVDFQGRTVTYVAPNMVDGLTDTCWRRAGDATGTVLTFRLDQPTRLTRVGLINGYAKIAYDRGHRFDWYHGNRRVLGVDWIFDDGTTVSQRLRSSRAMQQVPIRPVTTQVVRLRITAVSPPGRGRAFRNDTAISEVSLIGRPV